VESEKHLLLLCWQDWRKETPLGDIDIGEKIILKRILSSPLLECDLDLLGYGL